MRYAWIPFLLVAWAPLALAQPPEQPAEEGTEAPPPPTEETAEVASEGEEVEGETLAPAPGPPPIPSATEEQEPEGQAAPSSTNIPINFELHGYYRARLVTTDSQPVPGPSAGRDAAAHAAYGFMRWRLEPSIVFGNDRRAPVAQLNATIDALDNVVFGDNARLAGTPLFAVDPSRTSLLDGDLDDWIFLRRLWLEFLTPIGIIRIGRQGSHGGMGLLFNDGNDLPRLSSDEPDPPNLLIGRNDFGDALDGTTFDRILFATRPLTIVNTLLRGDSRPTPLILALAYDWLVEDSLGVASTPAPRRGAPFEFVTGSEDDVWETTLFLAWRDEKFNSELNVRDELTAGLVLVYRGQDATDSHVYIGDVFWRLLWSPFGRDIPQLYTEGELYTIQGTTNGVALFGPIDPVTGRTGMQGGADVWGGAFRLGVEAPIWAARVESGFSTGQHEAITAVGSYDALTQRPNNAAYQVGLLLYPLVLAVRTANGYTDTFRAVWSGGGVWNSIYFLPQVRVRPLPGVELIGQFLLAFADEVPLPLANPHLSGNTHCSVRAECILGWEADVAVKLSWGPNDEMRWSNEFGIMNAGPALGPNLAQSLIWTLQTRIAFVY